VNAVGAALRTLLARTIDHAGVYPPARLPLAEAAAEYARLRDTPAAWLLGRFVCPAGSLLELAALRTGAGGPPPVVAVVGTAGESADALVDGARADAAGIAAAVATGRVIVDQYEVRLPAALLAAGDAAAVAAAVARLAAVVSPACSAPPLLALEAPVAGAPPALALVAATGIAACNRSSAGARRPPAALKVRCGGLTAAAVPTAGELAAALAACRDRGVAVKATQGLHHPFRRRDGTLGVETHGFVNLLVAGALAAAGASPPELEAVLGDGEAASFRFSGEALAWRERVLSVADLAAGRRHGVLAFGSCSFAEPRDDLAGLGLMPQ